MPPSSLAHGIPTHGACAYELGIDKICKLMCKVEIPKAVNDH